MPKSLEYKDLRAAMYDTEFSDAKHDTLPKTLTTVKEITRSDGDYIYDQMDIKTLLTHIEDHHRQVRQLKQCITSLNGQLEYIYKNGIDEYITKIGEIRALHPIPTE